MRYFTAIFSFSFMILFTNLVYAQHINFVREGSIEFEKTVNMHAQIRKYFAKNNESHYLSALNQYKNSYPQFRVLKSTLIFSGNKTLFKPEPEDQAGTNVFTNMIPAANQNNIISTDLLKSTFIAQKRVFEETFLVSDSTRKIRWKITNETRDIAGYQCRRANAIIMDSIYVVAFYTDDIPVSGGPESFTGLPGMILGVALPYEKITWFAKAVSDKSIPAASIIPPGKGKATNNIGLISTLMNVLKNWGEHGKQSLKSFLL